MGQKLPQEKQTVLGLYVTAAEAYEKWQAAPDKVKLLDVRTPEEFLFVGHPEMAQCIPIGFQSYRWDDKRVISTWTSTRNSWSRCRNGSIPVTQSS